MREGLRSQTRSGKGSVQGEVVHKKRVRVKNEVLVSGDEGLVERTKAVVEALFSGDEDLVEPTSLIEKKGETESLVSGDEGLVERTKAVVEALFSGDEVFVEPTSLIEKKGETEALVSGDEGFVEPTSLIEKKGETEALVSGDEGLVEPTSLIEKGETEALVSGDEGLVEPTSLIEKKGETEALVLGDEGLVEATLSIEKKGEVEALFSGDEGLVEPTSSIEKNGETGALVSGDESLVESTSSIEKKGEVEALVLGDEVLVEPTSSIEKKGEVECAGIVDCAVKTKFDFDLNLDLSVNVNIDENENSSPRSCLKDGHSIAVADKKENEGLSGGRILRSRLKRGDDKRAYNGGHDCIPSENDGEHGQLEMIQVKKELEEADEVLTDGKKNDRVMLKMGGKGKKKLKRKRGRPPKTEIKEKDQLDDQPPRKLGRPRKTEIKEKDELDDQPPRKLRRLCRTELKEDNQSPRKLGRPRKTELKEDVQSPRKLERPPKTELKEDVQSPRKRGRPPKTEQQKHLLTLAHNSKGKVSREDGKKVVTVTDSESEVDDTRSRRSSGKKLKKKGFSPVRKNKLRKVLKTENGGMASNTVDAPVAKQSTSREEKKLVRDKIMECLSAAGWTVDRRPRNGRDYIDAVYVALDGKTHWSITLAYKRLKKHYEAGDGEGKLYRPGFKFTPISEEDFNSLTRVATKSRIDSKVKRVPFGGKGGKRVDGVNRKKKKIKPGSGAGKGKLVKGKKKRKRSLPEEGNSNVTSPNRDRKRHKTHNKTRCALLVRDATEEVDSEVNGYVPYSGKRTVLAWMIDLGTILQNGKVHYNEDKLEIAFQGKITGDGIQCGCCNEIITISDFGAHAGSKQSDPLKNIYTEKETSLLQCLLDSWNKQDKSELKSFHFVDVAGEDPNDDTCGVCGDGGDLICCDGCPSTFHKSCLDIKKFPSGDWHCIYCCCKFCGLVDGSSNQTVVNDDFTIPTLLTCHLCEEKFHISCIVANGDKTDDSMMANGDKTDDSRNTFCGNKCQELSERLEMLLGVKHEIEDGFSWSFIRRSDVGLDVSLTKSQTVECNSKLAVALSIMNECFMPYIDHRSGTNLIRSILYNCGSNFKRLNYSGFITAILERGDEIICVASIRIHGNQLAEMPFIGTRYMYRRQGMCRRLLNAIEWALSSLHVELLVIPAISELRETWTSVFGFEPLEQTSKQITKNMNLLVFPHVDMLQKKISKHEIANENLIATEVSNHKNLTTYKVAKLDGEDSSVSDCCPKIEKVISIESGCRHFENSLNNAPAITSDTIENSISLKDVTCHAVYETVHEKLGVDHKSTVNAGEDVAKSCCQVEDKERHCLSTSCINTEASQEHYVGAMSEVTENCCKEVKVTIEVGLNNNSDEKSAPSSEENIPIDSQIEFRTRESKYSAESNLDSPKISDSFEPRVKTDCAQPGCIGSEVYAESVNGCGSHSRLDGDTATGEAGLTTNMMHVESENTTKDLPANCENNSSSVSVPNADEADLYNSKTIDLQKNKNPGGCQSILVSSGICEKIADGVNETNKALDDKPADIEVILDDKPGSHSRPNGHRASGEAGLTTNTSMYLESQNITKDLPVNCENNSSVGAPTIDLQTNKNPGDCQSISVSSGDCEKIADGVNERNKASSAVDVFPFDVEVFPNNKSGIRKSSELAELDLQVDQTEPSNANIASGVALHCISTDSTSRGSTDGTVPANQGS
ncbi:unnamed protein product [Trifolium pratense]|uniref:Uncharacterized protein n=1 Tax=Trifolium pratense TaxID=57577 RepID=A0ACB0I6W1_TRIPR|nr:unnamed protein product [Trifolium pratense]